MYYLWPIKTLLTILKPLLEAKDFSVVCGIYDVYLIRKRTVHHERVSYQVSLCCD